MGNTAVGISNSTRTISIFCKRASAGVVVARTRGSRRTVSGRATGRSSTADRDAIYRAASVGEDRMTGNITPR